MTVPKARPPIPTAGDPGPPEAAAARPARLARWVLGLGLVGLLVWAALAPLDEGVPTQGMVTLDTKRKTVQHLSGGIVQQVLVREGQLVQEGQVLLVLDDAVARANHESVRQRYLALRAVQGRLLAEQSGARSISFHPDLLAAAQDPLIQHQMVTQQQLFMARQAALQADVQALQENIQGQQGLLQSYEGMVGHRSQQLASFEEELKHIRSLVTDGYAPRNRQRELERAVADLRASLAELQGSRMHTERNIAELRQRILSRQQAQRQEVESQLSDVTREVQSDAEKFPATEADLARTQIKSPASGQVVGLTVQTVGGVIHAGQNLMDVVPADQPLLLEARIDPHLIDKVKAGLKTDIRFNAFAHSPQLVVEGEVLSVSSDLLAEQHGNAVISYYLARLRVTPEGMQTLGSRRMQPGMPAEIIIKTGERSLITYLLSPLTKRLAASMKEE